jgi:hypothetical protein
MNDGGVKRVDAMNKFFREMYYAARYRKWVIYDPVDVIVIHLGTRRECYDIQKTSQNGLVVIPYMSEPFTDT